MLNKKSLLLSAFCVCVMLMQSSCFAQKQSTTAKSASRPNILVILVDDYGWRDIHAYGSDFYETPNMDKLIGESMKFTQAYSTYPRCVPSRFSIMTGSHPARLKGDGEGGKRDGESGFSIMAPNISIGKAMHDNGYKTFYIGKWHLGGEEYAPLGSGFDQSIAAGEAGATSSHFAPYNLTAKGQPGKEAKIPDLDDAPKGQNLEDRLTDETIKLLKEDAKTGKPFFGILAHYAVHTPIEGKEEYIKYFKEKLKKNPPPAGPDYIPESAGETKQKQDNATYAAMIKSVDDGVGKILQALQDLGVADNTIIIVTSDHGGLSSRGNTREVATTNLPLRAGKGHLYEGGTRVPMFVKWPGVVKPNSETNSIIQGIDHFSSILEMAGGMVPAAQINDGRSYVNILKGAKADVGRTLFWHNPAPRPTSTGDIYSSSIRSGDFKLIDFYGLGRKELYNIKTDIGEKNDIAAQNPEMVKKLYAELEAWRKKMGADMRLKPSSMSEAEKASGGVKLSPEEAKKEARKEEKKQQRKEDRKAGKN